MLQQRLAARYSSAAPDSPAGGLEGQDGDASTVGSAGAGSTAGEDALARPSAEELVRCFAYILPQKGYGYCGRANSVALYQAMNREIMTWPTSAITVRAA